MRMKTKLLIGCVVSTLLLTNSCKESGDIDYLPLLVISQQGKPDSTKMCAFFTTQQFKLNDEGFWRLIQEPINLPKGSKITLKSGESFILENDYCEAAR